MLDRAAMGWMAAVIDLKALLLRKSNQMRRTPQLVMVVDSRDFTIIDRLSAMTGTKPEASRQQSLKEWMQRGCREHCPEAHIHHHDHWAMPSTRRWSVTGVSAATILWNLRTMLVSDKPYAEFLELALRNAAVRGQGSGATRQALRRLMTLGWDVPPMLLDAMFSVDEVIMNEIEAGVRNAESQGQPEELHVPTERGMG